jgi:hypothetical protein
MQWASVVKYQSNYNQYFIGCRLAVHIHLLLRHRYINGNLTLTKIIYKGIT